MSSSSPPHQTSFSPESLDELNLIQALYPGENELEIGTTENNSTIIKYFILTIENPLLKRIIKITIGFTHNYPANEPPKLMNIVGLDEEEEIEFRNRLNNIYTTTWNKGDLILLNLITVAKENIDELFHLVQPRICKVCYGDIEKIDEMFVVSCPKRHILHQDCWKSWIQSSMTTESKLDKAKANETTRIQISAASENDLKMQIQKIQTLEHMISELDIRDKFIRTRISELTKPTHNNNNSTTTKSTKQKRSSNNSTTTTTSSTPLATTTTTTITTTTQQQRQEPDNIVDDISELERRLLEIKDLKRDYIREKKVTMDVCANRQAEFEATLAKLRVDEQIQGEKLATVRCPLCQEIVKSI
jgi:hypothetical protein